MEKKFNYIRQSARAKWLKKLPVSLTYVNMTKAEEDLFRSVVCNALQILSGEQQMQTIEIALETDKEINDAA